MSKPTSVLGTASEYAEGPSIEQSEGRFGLNCRGTIADFDIQFDFVILRISPTAFQYRIINEQMVYTTRPDVPGQESPRWMTQLEPESVP